jgi:hypothetical protein
VLSASSTQTPASATAVDVSTVKIGSATTVAELDLGKLKGELRQVSWNNEGTQFYIQTTEGAPPSQKLHHYAVAAAGGAVTSIAQQPDWAEAYWAFKSDRAAPGIGSLLIDVEQKVENVKIGTGSAGAADRTGDALGGGNVVSGANVERAAESQHVKVIRLKLFDEAVSEFFNEPAVPGLMFSWGPTGSATIAFTDRDGRLILLDQRKHKQTVSGVKDALLPAWSMDGSRLAWVQKSGRKKYTLMWTTVSKG